MKIGKDLSVGKLVWGYCAGWWPALIIDADHVGMLSEEGKLWVYWIGEARISLLNEKTQIEPFSCNLKARLTQNLNVPRIRAIDATMQMLRKKLGGTLTKPYFTWIESNFPKNMIEMLDEIKFYPYPVKMQQRLDHLREKNAKVTERYLLDQKRENQEKKLAEKSKDSPQKVNVDLTLLPLKEQKPGIIAWAKIAGHNWWPAMIIDYRDCCMREPTFGCQWIMWYGDYKLSEVHHQLFLRFDKGMEKMRDYTSNTKKHIYLVGVLQASKDYCSRLGFDTSNWTLDDAFEYFSKPNHYDYASSANTWRREDSVKIYDKYSARIAEKLNELKDNPNVDDERANDINNSDDLRSAIKGEISFDSLCLKCLRVSNDEMDIHPFFEGSLCKDCSVKNNFFSFLESLLLRVFSNQKNLCSRNDINPFYCTVCAASGMVIICDKEDCPRVYCTACMKHLLCPTTYEQVLQEDPWECFLCKSRSFTTDTIVRPRANWKDKIINMFRTSCDSNVEHLVAKHNSEKRKIRVLSLFDGLGTGLLVLLKLGFIVDAYYASEIDQDALMVTASHFGDRILQLGNVKDITCNTIKEIAPIDLLIGGSPCNDLSLANPARLGLHDPRGTGVLFFEYRRILKLVRKLNNERHLFWLYENVASMPSEYRLEINKHLGQEPDVIDSADFSPQHRLRLYWHNFPIEPRLLSSQREQDVQDILTPHCQRYSLVKKIRTVTTKVNSLKQGKLALKPILMKDESDSLWITELEEIFGFPRHYTDVKNLSATKRQRLIGKSWSVQTLTAIFESLCPFFERDIVEIEG
ncbi:DNA methyltransferase 3 isoform X1 [Apis mellifera carnica]|nr:DNA methyltransferase 3 isoform X1 [Apis mellifera carnica]